MVQRKDKLVAKLEKTLPALAEFSPREQCFPQSQQTESRSRSRSRRKDKFGGHNGHTWTDQEGLEYGHVWIEIENE